MIERTMTLDDFPETIVVNMPVLKNSVIRFDRLVKAYEKSTGYEFTDVDSLSAWTYEIQGRAGYRDLRAARWNRGNLNVAYRAWLRCRAAGLI